MRWIAMTGLAAALALPTLAIEAAQRDAVRPAVTAQRQGNQPLDAGPRTPDANAAHRGGGVILESKPGGSAPEPRATPPVPAGSYAPLVVGPTPAISQ
jgi:hypothetical protein